MKFLNREIICNSEESLEMTDSFGDENFNANIVVRSSDNSQTLYIDGAGEGGWPVYIGVTKSRGNQKNKLPIEPNDMIGGLQVYSRTRKGQSLGYNHAETPLTGSIIFKAGDSTDDSELLIAVKENDHLKVKLILDSKGNLGIAGNIVTGNLTITDSVTVPKNHVPVKYIKVIHDGIEYAMPLYLIQ
jgi:hypothetical protein